MRRRLDTELVRRGLVPSRTRAAAAIADGRVLVNGGPVTSPARQVGTDEAIRLTAGAPAYVSRGGDKLAGALAGLAVEVRGRRALDAGASTGGFTDCLLQHGAARVYAVDVGRGQLAWSLRVDPRVVVLERTNVRTLEPAAIEGPVPVTVADLSFISLATVAPALAACTDPTGDLILLVKPQFEAGRSRVGRGGIVRDPEVHAAVLGEVAEALAGHGLVVVDAVASPIAGRDGNREFFLHARPAAGSPAAMAADALARVAAP